MMQVDKSEMCRVWIDSILYSRRTKCLVFGGECHYKAVSDFRSHGRVALSRVFGSPNGDDLTRSFFKRNNSDRFSDLYSSWHSAARCASCSSSTRKQAAVSTSHYLRSR